MSTKCIILYAVIVIMLIFGACQLEDKQKGPVNAGKGFSTIIEKDDPGWMKFWI